MPVLRSLLLIGLFAAPCLASPPPTQPLPERAWTVDFMRRLAEFAHENHLKKDADSPQRGMMYEYLDMTRRGQSDQFIQGEALDTMHDGAWFAAALVNAYRATGDAYYKRFLTADLLPFYLKMLNHSDTLFRSQPNDARPGAHAFNREHALQDGEKGFVPYWWDDGGSISLERLVAKNPRGAFACTDAHPDAPNPDYRLNGYSHGSSNHLAQDLGVMLQAAWLLLRESHDETDKKLAAEVAEAARNLVACRMNHHGHIPMCDAPAALAHHDAALWRRLPDQSTAAAWAPSNHSYRALYDFKPGQSMSLPGFADDQQYRYYAGLARHGGQLPRALAFRTIYDAFTEPMLYRYYWEDAQVPPGLNRFDLHPYSVKDGKLADYASDRKGPGGNPRPAGSRFGPQNMVCCGWALQAIEALPGIWTQRHQEQFADDTLVWIDDPIPVNRLNPRQPPFAKLEFPEAKVELRSTRDKLIVRGTLKEDSTSITVYSRPGGQGSCAILELKRGGPAKAENDRAEKLVCQDEGARSEREYDFFVTLPYTVIKGQGAWANGVEHGRYSIQVGDTVKNFYLASPEDQVRDRLRMELAAGLQTWEAIFREKGYIPTGIGAGSMGGGRQWDHMSDNGGYAHLISACAQWIIYLDKQRDWELHHVPSVASEEQK